MGSRADAVIDFLPHGLPRVDALSEGLRCDFRNGFGQFKTTNPGSQRMDLQRLNDEVQKLGAADAG